MGKMDIINSTLGKALGGAAGGYTTGPKALIDLLRQRSRPYLFSNTLPPPIVASAIKAIDMIEKDSSLPGRVLENATFFRREMQALGFKILGDNHPICPVMLGDARLASQFADEMLKRGIYVIGFSFPVVSHWAASVLELRCCSRYQRIMRVSVCKCRQLIPRPILSTASNHSPKLAAN